MKRPQLIHFFAIATTEQISVKAFVSFNRLDEKYRNGKRLPQKPYQAFRLLRAHRFSLKVIGLDANQNNIFEEDYKSDFFGKFNFKIPTNKESTKPETLQLYETSVFPGIQINLGSHIPLKMMAQKKIIICDFDKTLVDTKYSSLLEIYNSLTNPLENFPILKKSITILQDFVKKEYHPFILSGSPHFYENAIRDWLYRNNIYTAGIFLKDYRQIFSIMYGILALKDIKTQGLYKMIHLVDILLMTGIPDALVLMGDNFESDPIIYLTLATILEDELDPWTVWNMVKKQESFRLTNSQNTCLLEKLYQLRQMTISRKNFLENNGQIDINIFIRRKHKNDAIEIPVNFLNEKRNLITLYDG